MNAMTNVPRFLGTTIAQDRTAMSVCLPDAQEGANASMRALMQRFEEEVSAVENEPTHPTLTWIDYRETARVEHALQVAWDAFWTAMGRPLS